MAKKRHTAEQIISRLREAEILLAKGTKMPQVCRKLGVTEQTYYRWRKEYGGVRTDQVKRLKGGGEGGRPAQEVGRGFVAGQRDPEGGGLPRLLSPPRRRQVVDEVREKLGVSERRACRVLGQPRSTQRRQPYVAEDEPRLVTQMIELASEYGRYGYRRITALLRHDGWKVNHKRIERLWRREGLKVPKKQPKRGRLWLNDGSCIRLRPEYKDHVWAYDLVPARTHDGRAVRMLTLVDEYTRECLSIDVARRLTSEDVLERLTWLFVTGGVPQFVRSDNGSEFTAQAVRDWLAKVGVKTLYIEPGSPWENGYVESFNGKLRDELLDREIFYTLLWRRRC